MSDVNDIQRIIELERADASRQALVEAVEAIGRLDGNELYQRAWKQAAIAVKALLARK